MKISFFPSVKSKVPQLCTWDLFCNATDNQSMIQIAALIAKAVKAGNRDQKDKLKKKLPIVTWQAWFENERKNNEAHPNGLYMLDVDHLKELPEKVYAQKIAGRLKELQIVLVHKTISCEGIRIVAKCRKGFNTIVDNQRWLANELGLEMDEACKDWARSSFLVPYNYFLYHDATIFDPNVTSEVVLENRETETSKAPVVVNTPSNQNQYKGLELLEIANKWLKAVNGGFPIEGERNQVLYRLATRMKYITDFNPQVICNNIPHCGLSDSEVLQLCTSACGGQRALTMPADLERVIEKLSNPTTENFEEIPITKIEMPQLPPLFEQFAEIAPDDFKEPVVLCLLPMLGTLASRLRAKYLNGKYETPTFMVALEAPQASGKSFIEDVSAKVMFPITDMDEKEREKEREFEEQIKTIKAAGTGTKAERAEVRELLENRPIPIIRYMPATASITKLLIRMSNADGLHLFAMAVEVDTVAKAFKRGFSNLSDLLRCAYDNSEFGQEYASDTSFSGKVRIFYNTLYSGTPAAMRHFYNNSEDGTMSRTLFVTLPDQFGKKMPVWSEFTEDQLVKVNGCVEVLNSVSIVDGSIQNPHNMDMSFLNDAISEWIEKQRELSVQQLDRTRNIFYRRCAETGFRAGMLAWFLYGETEACKSLVCDFAIWVAEKMLSQFLLRINISNEDIELGNLFARQVYVKLEDTFTRSQLESELVQCGFKTKVKQVVYKWRQAGVISSEERYGAQVYVKTLNNGQKD